MLLDSGRTGRQPTTLPKGDDVSRRQHDHRESADRRSAPLPRLIDQGVALEAARQALAVGEALAAERIRVAAEYALTPTSGPKGQED